MYARLSEDVRAHFKRQRDDAMEKHYESRCTDEQLTERLKVLKSQEQTVMALLHDAEKWLML